MLTERLSTEVEILPNEYIPKSYNNNNIPKACICIITCIILPILIYIFIIEIKQTWINIFNQI